jgi:hypothetical protein
MTAETAALLTPALLATSARVGACLRFGTGWPVGTVLSCVDFIKDMVHYSGLYFSMFDFVK